MLVGLQQIFMPILRALGLRMRKMLFDGHLYGFCSGVSQGKPEVKNPEFWLRRADIDGLSEFIDPIVRVLTTTEYLG